MSNKNTSKFYKITSILSLVFFFLSGICGYIAIEFVEFGSFWHSFFNWAFFILIGMALIFLIISRIAYMQRNLDDK